MPLPPPGGKALRATFALGQRAAGPPADAIGRLAGLGVVGRPLMGTLRTPQAGFLPLPVDALIDLLPMHGHLLWRVDAAPHLVAFDAEDRERHRIADHDGLAHSSREDQHTLRAPCCFALGALVRRQHTTTFAAPAHASRARAVVPPHPLERQTPRVRRDEL